MSLTSLEKEFQGAEEKAEQCKMADTAAKLRAKRAERDAIVRRISRLEVFAYEAQEVNNDQLKDRMNRVDKCWDDFQKVTNELRLIDDPCKFEENESMLDEMEEKCMRISDLLRSCVCVPLDIKPTPANMSVNVSDSAKPHVHLPSLSLPEFSGKFEEWLPFHDLFSATVHTNTKLADVQKMAYLRQVVKGEAASLVNAFPAIGDSYEAAWDALVKRYANAYLLKKRYINTLLQYPRIKSSCRQEVHCLVDTFERCTKLLDRVGENTSQWGMLLLQLMVSKLDDDTQMRWEQHVEQSNQCSVQQLMSFLHSKSRILEASAEDRVRVSTRTNDRRSVNVVSEGLQKCSCCERVHYLGSCSVFQSKPIEDRHRLVVEKKLCRNCLYPGHISMACKSKRLCSTCSKKHHSLLHRDMVRANTVSEDAIQTSNAGANINDVVVNNATASPEGRQVFLSTAVVLVKGRGRKQVCARALLDNGAQVNIMTEALCRKLNLSRKGQGQQLVGVGNHMVCTAQSVESDIASRLTNYKRTMNFLVLPSITSYKPAMVNATQLQQRFDLADPDLGKGGEIDLLLGSEFYHEFLQPHGNRSVEVRNPTGDLPAFINSVFGWLATGKAVDRSHDVKHVQLCIMHVGICSTLEEQISKFWEIEQIPEASRLTPDEEECEKRFREEHYRDECGRYVVKLPFKASKDMQLGESKSAAVKRFEQLERRFKREPSLKKEYSAVIADYVERGYLKKVPDTLSTSSIQCFLPHHPVLKEASTSTKVRPVFDGSAKTTSGWSLNDVLLKGPVIQDSLMDLLLRFRMRPIAITADIAKMYLQVKVHPEHTAVQRILWRSEPSHPLDTLELQRVTFGLTPSSFLATRVLHQLAEDEGNVLPLAKRALLHDFYVDDFIGGADTEAEAMKLQEQLASLLSKGGFHLQKWSSNSSILLERIDPIDRASNVAVSFPSDEPVKTLGIAWHPVSDQLSVEANMVDCIEPLTRRRVYSMIARLFDPIGLIAPIISWAKIKMQQLWLATQDWDEPLSPELTKQWQEFHSNICVLSKLKIPRYVCLLEPISMQFHCFADASEAAYGAVLYLRSEDQSGNVKVALVAAKSRPAPLKRVSLARLELCAAVMATKLRESIGRSLNLEDNETYMWSDSTVVLHWLRSPSYTWTTYVANRVSLIQTTSKGYRWMHVKGTQNPADILSRGALPNQLIASEMWFTGPSWLTSTRDQWPANAIVESPAEEILEKKAVHLTTVERSNSEEWCERYSCYHRMLRITAYCLRFLKRCRSKDGSRNISVDEMRNAKLTLIRMIQLDHFATEIKELQHGRPVPPKSKLRMLGAFLDEGGLLRVGGRCSKMSLPYERKHPLVLPRKTRFSRLITEAYHRAVLHGGPTATLSMLRRELWVLQGRTLVNSVCRSCTTCFRMNPATVQQPPGQLPIERVTEARPFSTTGVDFCGPIHLKPVHRRAAAEKAYIAIFVCFAVKAVHIELVETLSTPAFLDAFRRFISRRGKPMTVYSDNGLNFQGASNHLKELYAMLRSDAAMREISRYAVSMDMEWHFIPPIAPNFGGLWEAAVKIAKRTLLKVIGTRQLSFGEMATILTQVEAQLNSRPLTPLSEDPTELNVLTPGHFLIGAPLSGLPDCDVSEVPVNRLKRFEQMQQLLQQHWRRWRREYLCELHNANQRGKKKIAIREGNIVLLKDDSKIPLHWPLGRIIKTYPGPDGIVRVVDVKTVAGNYKRPVNRICLLPFEVSK